MNRHEIDPVFEAAGIWSLDGLDDSEPGDGDRSVTGAFDLYAEEPHFLELNKLAHWQPPPPAKKLLQKGAHSDQVLFLKLSKIDPETRTVYGIATSEALDRDSEICDYESSKPYFKEWSDSVARDTQGISLGNIREMHRLQAAGTVSQIKFDDFAKRIEIAAKVVDNDAWQKILTRTYSGFSIGGRYLNVWKDASGHTRFTAVPCEISLVDRPANPDATFSMVKGMV